MRLGATTSEAMSEEETRWKAMDDVWQDMVKQISREVAKELRAEMRDELRREVQRQLHQEVYQEQRREAVEAERPSKRRRVWGGAVWTASEMKSE